MAVSHVSYLDPSFLLGLALICAGILAPLLFVAQTFRRPVAKSV